MNNVTYESLAKGKDRIAVVGLGYVGLPLAVRLSGHFSVTGYDINEKRVAQLQSGEDRTLEVPGEEMQKARIFFTSNGADLESCRLIIVAVPTPIDEYRIPDLTPVKSATQTVGAHLSPGTCVVFESTVYPGVTQEVCIPILEKESGLAAGKGFSVGYSPERINPGDREHTLENVVKIVSGLNEETANLLQDVYGEVVGAGIHRASCIKVAEAAKVIENTQRDLNIALMNELAMIFHKMGIDTTEVLEAAGTKWNFMPFRPGLVGGHCIGVDPYYLTFKAESMGYHPEMILAGRRINDNMGKYVAERTVKILIQNGKTVNTAKIAVLGVTFKENVPDLRNTKVVDIIGELEDYGCAVRVHDPLADPMEAREHYGITLTPMEGLSDMDAVILAVRHRTYMDMGLLRIAQLCGPGGPIVVDVKAAFDPKAAKKMGISYWRL